MYAPFVSASQKSAPRRAVKVNPLPMAHSTSQQHCWNRLLLWHLRHWPLVRCCCPCNELIYHDPIISSFSCKMRSSKWTRQHMQHTDPYERSAMESWQGTACWPKIALPPQGLQTCRSLQLGGLVGFSFPPAMSDSIFLHSNWGCCHEIFSSAI